MRDLPNHANRDYVDRVNRAVDYVTANLASPLPLEEVARAACFSSYHFHRIFRGLMGETLASFVKRVRLERALYLMSHRHGAGLTEIALACGFSSSSDFSRSFKARYGVAPSRFDTDQFRRSRREEMQASVPPPGEGYRLESVPVGANTDGFAVTLRDQPARRVAYIRVLRPYEGQHVPQAIDRLCAWAETRGLADGQWLGYQWDDPEIVPLDKCRYDIGLEIPGRDVGEYATNRLRNEAGGPDVSITEFPRSVVAEIDIQGSVELELRALHWLFLGWLPASGYAPAHQPMFEAFNGRPFAHGTEHFELRVQLPVVELGIPL